ncbi:uncharacterized protein LOC124414615 [Diprion similis]|uniref:uncharacterized protein LOC124414615 n=1 Tax=Diprion similis TaxID=362088 RepID=UPI001EF7E68E|nr:uncharacterized protein LOC124414615 [Diprion similis]
MKVIILLAVIGSSATALVPVGPLEYPNLISTRRTEFPTQRLDVTALDDNLSQQYILYNVPQINTAVRTVPMAVFANGRPTIAHVPTAYNYYGTPVYDFRFPYTPLYPAGSKPPVPEYIPRPGIPQPPIKPVDYDDNDDEEDNDGGGIEKLDEKVEPGYDPLGEAASAANNEDASNENDSVIIEAA